MYSDYIITNPKIEEVATDVLCVEFWKPEFCEVIIEAADSLNKYESSPNDPVPGAELRISEISPEFFVSFCKHWKMIVQPILEEYYTLPTKDWFVGWKIPFIIKYTMSGQRSLRPHMDASLISGSIKLNDNYEGGELVFPRQKFTNKKIPVGSIILWPSSIQHVHYSSELISGIKYSLTAWTMQTVNDAPKGILYNSI
jgi:hypothetical protein